MPPELSAQEQAVLEQIAHNPFASQQEIADALGLARSTVAAHIVSLMQKGRILGRGYVLPSRQTIACIGGAVLDRKYRARGAIRFEADNAVETDRSHGGMARNVAENLARLGHTVSLTSLLGDDETGREIRNALRDLGIDVSTLGTSETARTAEYSLILDHRGDLMMGLSEMSVFEQITPDRIERGWPQLAAASWIFLDANPPLETMSALIARARGTGIRLAVAGVSEQKMRHFPSDLRGVELMIVTVEEARALLSRAEAGAATTLTEGISLARSLLDLGLRSSIVIGPGDICCAGPEGEAHLVPIPATLIDATGAIDGFVAGTLHHLTAGHDLIASARQGMLLQALTLESPGTVRSDLSAALLDANAVRLDRPAPPPHRQPNSDPGLREPGLSQ